MTDAIFILYKTKAYGFIWFGVSFGVVEIKTYKYTN